jgi:hypothetical protein
MSDFAAAYLQCPQVAGQATRFQPSESPSNSAVQGGGLGPSADTPELGRCHAPVKSRRPVRYVRQPAEWITATHTSGGDSASQAAGLYQRDTQAIGLRTNGSSPSRKSR